MSVAGAAVASPGIRVVRRRRIARIVFWALFLLAPWILETVNWLGIVVSANLAAIAVLAALSIVILTGWIGQISLCQAAFLGMGAYTAGQVQNHFGIAFPWHLPFAGAAGGITALVIGIPALRLKGLYLAIATLTFQWAMESSFFRFGWFAGGLDGVRIRPPVWGPQEGLRLDLTDQRIFFYFTWATVLLLALLAANLRDSKIGRAWFAIRGSETAARTLGIDVTRYKLIGFVFSGFYAGVAGALLINWVSLVTFDQFLFSQSLTYLSTAVLGGIVHLIGSFIAGLAFAAIRFALDNFEQAAGFLPAIVGLIVIVTILMNPGGLAHSFQEALHKLRERRGSRSERQLIRARARATAARLLGNEPAATSDGSGLAGEGLETQGGAGSALQSSEEALGGATEPEGDGRVGSILELLTLAETELRSEPSAQPRAEGEAVLHTEGATVRFGGVIANDDVSVKVRKGEIVGLIGPNGAGKTTLFNVISGLVRQDSGRVILLESDVSTEPVHARAEAGLGRTFQLIRLFPRLSVHDNLMVATHVENPSGFWSNLLISNKARTAEHEARARVDEVIDLLGLGRVAGSLVAGLPFGVLRMVELARALVTKPKVLLLDEPASGLDVAETDQLARILMDVRKKFDISILLIEHDMRLVMMVSDYVYVLDFGRVLAEGAPAEVQTDERVIAAYLGEQEIAVAVG